MCDLKQSTNDDKLNDFVEEHCDNLQPAGKRWDPLGAAATEENNDVSKEFNIFYQIQPNGSSHDNRIKFLEDEQEVLTSSLLALTSHFAQVQFRLRQIVDAPAIERDRMLKNLEEFAFRGIPEITNLNQFDNSTATQKYADTAVDISDHRNEDNKKIDVSNSGGNIMRLIEDQKSRQYELMEQLKDQLHDLETSDTSSTFDLLNIKSKKNVFPSPMVVKKQLVRQLKVQISELERFLSCLQDEADQKTTPTSNINKNIETCDVSNDLYKPSVEQKKDENRTEYHAKNNYNTEESLRHQNQQNQRSGSSRAFNIMSKTSTLMQIFAITQFGCGRSTTNMESNYDSSNRGHQDFQRNLLKKFNKFNHWGDIRAQLEIDIQEIVGISHQIKILAKNTKSSNTNPKRRVMHKHDKEDTDCDGNNDENDSDILSDEQILRELKQTEKYSLLHSELTTIVRKNFAITLKRLIQHGIYRDMDTSSIVPFIGCFATPSSTSPSSNYKQRSSRASTMTLQSEHDMADFINDAVPIRSEMGLETTNQPSQSCDGMMNGDSGLEYYIEYDRLSEKNPWELILEYYYLKKGDAFNDTPARKLSQSFNLDIVGGAATSNKQSLLSAIGSIIRIHGPYRRSYDTHFKAFVCAGLNAKKLCQWLNLIFQCKELVNVYYTDWSYVSVTGFRDALKSMERLNPYHFELPVDLAIKQFQNIKDVFM